jgi:uncharacterized membrane protein YraQ (UPF0718 family)
MDLFLSKVVEFSLEIIPWVLLGSIIDYILGKAIKLRTIVPYLQHPKPLKLFVVQSLGMVSPFTTMSFLPVAGKLASRGASPGMLLGFLAAEIAYGIQSFFIITSLFGFTVALLHFLALSVSLFLASLYVRNDKAVFKQNPAPSYVAIEEKYTSLFLYRQARVYVLVFMGIFVGAALAAFVPSDAASFFQANIVVSMFGAVVLSAVIYLGTIFGNYPVAASFLDIGMPMMSVFTFLVLSPLVNLVVVVLFMSVIRARTILRFTFVYAIAGLALSIFASLLLF